jgi:probable HAF family extracellular repeat protein
MKQRFRMRWLLAILFLLLVGFLVMSHSPAAQTAAPPAVSGVQYQITDLGTLPGGNSSYAVAINELGQVAGSATVNGWSSEHAILWLPEPAYGLPAGMNDLGTFALNYSQAYDINDMGYVVGYSTIDDEDSDGHGFLWRPGLGMMDLGTLGGDDSEAHGVNNAGQVVGEAYNSDDERYAFLWQDGQMNSLDPLNPQDTENEAHDVNESGQVAGQSSIEFATHRATLWINGSPMNLGTLGGKDSEANGGSDSEAHGLNDAGQVVGASGTSDDRLSAFIWLPEAAYGLPEGMNDITPDASQAQIYNINNQGQAVGYGVYNNPYHNGAILWDAGTTYRLNELIDPDSGWHINSAYDIIDAGQIVGIGTFNGQPRAFLLTPAAWTILHYIAGDNNLGYTYSPIFNHLETLADTPGVNILVLWDNQANGDSAYYEVQYDTDPNSLANYTEGTNTWAKGELDTGFTTALSDFVSWGIENYPAQQHALILDDHGSGLGGGLCDGNGGPSCASKMNLAEMQLALATAYSATGEKLDVLYMAMCLMGMIEDAYQFRDYTDFYVASQHIQTAYSNYLTGLDAELTPAEVATLFASNYAEAMTARNKAYTISVVDIAQLPALVTVIDQLADELLMQFPEVAPTLFSLFSLVQRYDNKSPRGITPADTYADLYDLAHLINQNLSAYPDIAASAQDVMAAVNAAVIYEAHASTATTNLDNSHGLAIFFPGNPSSFYYGENNDFAAGTDWGKPPSLAPAAGGISWGPMLVEYISLTNPNGPDDALPPEPIAKDHLFDFIFLPAITR